jgi:hypothetical protein
MTQSPGCRTAWHEIHQEIRVKHAGVALFLAVVFTSVSFPATADVHVKVTNNLSIARPSETVELKWGELSQLLPNTRPDHVIVTGQDGREVLAQPIWFTGEKKKKPADEFVFQADFAAGETKTFGLAAGTPAPYQPRVYGRWVPERHDDFAWENDRIAYRIYGPELSIVEPASSGVDVWPKRTPNLIINKWYQIAQSINDGYYHTDHGEGLDNYRIGHGQGCGGTAILLQGKRLTTGIQGWKTQRVLANGPIRLIFELTYPPIDVNGVGVSETKRVTLDAGQNLNHYQSTFAADKPLDNLLVMSGIGEHKDRPFEKDFHKETGWMSCWDAGDAPGEKRPPPGTAPTGYVGTAVVMLPAQVEDALELDAQMELVTKATPGVPVDFWAGAGWDQSGDFKDYNAWKAYVADFEKRVTSPLSITISH